MSLRYRGHKECHLRDVQVPQFSSSLQSSLSFQTLGFPVAQQIHLQCRRQRRLRFDPWVGNIPWSRKWKPTPVFLPGKSHGQRSLVGYSLWGRKELDTIEHTDEVCSFRKSASYVLKFRENFFVLSSTVSILSQPQDPPSYKQINKQMKTKRNCLGFGARNNCFRTGFTTY